MTPQKELQSQKDFSISTVYNHYRLDFVEQRHRFLQNSSGQFQKETMNADLALVSSHKIAKFFTHKSVTTNLMSTFISTLKYKSVKKGI